MRLQKLRTSPAIAGVPWSAASRTVLIGLVAGAISLASAPRIHAQSPAMWGRSPARNNVASGSVRLDNWAVPAFDFQSQTWKPNSGRGVRWAARVGNPTHGSPVVSGGRVLIGSNNNAAYLRRYPADFDLGCLLCFRESDGKFLWQYSAAKHPGGRVHDWPNQGLCSTPLVEGDRVWFVDNRGCVVCLDAAGFGDGEDDGPEQGVTEAVVMVDELLEASLWQVPLVVRETFKKVGVQLGPCTIGSGGKDGEWLVKPRGDPAMPAEVFRIRREGHELVGYRKADRSGDGREPPLFRIENRLFPGIEADRFGPELRALLQRHDIRLPDAAAIRTDAAGRAWSFALGEGADVREYRLKLESKRLSLTMHARQGNQNEADVVWRLDMPNQLRVFPHAMSTCSPVVWGDVLFVGTSNGVDESHYRVPSPDAPSFLALDKHTGAVLWSDTSPGDRIQHGQWSSPAVGVLGGVPQVIFAGGDGWVYSFRADKWDRETSRPIPLWRFDCNPKESRLVIGGRGTRSQLVATPVIYEGLVYIATGDDPEYGEGEGHLWCIDPTRRGDASPQLAQKTVDGQPVQLPPRRVAAVVPEDGEFAVANPNSAAVWHYSRQDRNGDGKFDFEETMHRAIATAVVANGLLVIPDHSGLVHCLDARTGKCHWTSDVQAACTSSPLVVGDRVVICDSDGDVAIYQLTAQTRQQYRPPTGQARGGFSHHEPLAELRLNLGATSTPVFANNVLYLADGLGLYAIAPDK